MGILVEVRPQPLWGKFAVAQRLGRSLALMMLDFSAMTGPRWALRFIISVGRVAEDGVLLFYGARFGVLMELPANPEYSVPMMAHLPARYVPVLAKGCVHAMLQGGPVRIQEADSNFWSLSGSASVTPAH